MRRLVILAALLAAACTTQAPLPTDTHRVLPPAKAVTSVDLENAADGTKVTLARGNELKVLLDAEALAGFQWRYPGNVAPVLAPIGDRIFLSKGIDPRYLGGGGWNVFRYKAEQPGKVTLRFAYGQFDPAAPATRSVSYEVTVE